MKDLDKAGLLTEKLDDVYRHEANDSFHNYVGLVKSMTDVIAQELAAAKEEGAREERISWKKAIANIDILQFLLLKEKYEKEYKQKI